MTFAEYAVLINKWTEVVREAGITLSDGGPVPTTFWKTFLGLKRKHHQDMFRGTFKNKSGCVPAYIAQTIRFAGKLEREVFLDEVRHYVPVFEADKNS